MAIGGHRKSPKSTEGRFYPLMSVDSPRLNDGGKKQKRNGDLLGLRRRCYQQDARPQSEM